MPLNLRTKSSGTLFTVQSDEAKDTNRKCLDLLKSLGYDLSHTFTYLKCLKDGNIELCIGFHSLGVITPMDDTYPETLFRKLYKLVREEVGAWNCGVIVLCNCVLDWYLVTNELCAISPNYDFSRKVMENVNIKFYESVEDYSTTGKDITEYVETHITVKDIKKDLKQMLCNGADADKIGKYLTDICYAFPFRVESVVVNNEKGIQLGMVWSIDICTTEKNKYVQMIICNNK